MKICKIYPADEFTTSGQMHTIRTLNTAKRLQFVNSLSQESNFYDKIEKLRHLFLSGGYDYDYDYIFSTDPNAKPSVKRVAIDGELFDIPAFTDNQFGLSPTVHVTKLAQCTTYASDSCSILRDSGIACNKATGSSFCLNANEGTLKKIGHQFVTINLKNGKRFNLDITSDIMKRDAERLGLDVDYKKLDRNL